MVRTRRKTKQKPKRTGTGRGSVDAAFQVPRACHTGQVGNTHRVEDRSRIWEACDVNKPSWASHLSEISLQLEYSGPMLVFLSKEPSWGERRGRSAGGEQGARQG